MHLEIRGKGMFATLPVPKCNIYSSKKQPTHWPAMTGSPLAQIPVVRCGPDTTPDLVNAPYVCRQTTIAGRMLRDRQYPVTLSDAVRPQCTWCHTESARPVAAYYQPPILGPAMATAIFILAYTERRWHQYFNSRRILARTLIIHEADSYRRGTMVQCLVKLANSLSADV